MDSELLQQLKQLGQPRQLVDGETLCREGERGAEAFAVISGSLAAVVDLAAVPTVVATHGPGTLVGEITTVVGGPRTASLIAQGPTTVAVLPKTALSAWLDENAEAALAVLDLARTRTDRNRAAALLGERLAITDRDLAVALADQLDITTHAPGDRIVTAGTEAARAGVIISGRVSVIDGDVRTERTRGDVIGIEALFGDVAPATVETTRDSTVGWLSRASFAELVSRYPLPVVALVRRLTALHGVNPKRTTRSVAIVTVDAAAEPHVATMATAIGARASVRTLDSATVDAMLGVPGLAHCEADEPGSRRIEELLHQLEVEHDVLLLHAREDDEAWLERAVSHADHVVIIRIGLVGEIKAVIGRIRSNAPDIPVWLAIEHGPEVTRPSGTSALRRQLGVAEIHHMRAGRRDDVARVGRLAAGAGIGLVLSGGGGRGFAHIGAIRSLQERGVPIDRIAGASMGSVIAASVAIGLEGEALIDHVEQQFEGLLDYTVPLVSVLKGERIARNIVDSFGAFDIEDLWVPFGCVTTNLTRNRVEVHHTGPLDHAIRSSVAIPGILPPVPWGEDLLVDGGVLDNLPLDLMTGDPSVRTIIAVDVAPPTGPRAKADYGLSVSGWAALRDRLGRHSKKLPSLGSVLMRSMTVGSAQQRDQRLASGAADLYLHLNLSGVGLLDFENVRPVEKRGYDAADPEIEAWLASDQF